MRWRLCHGRIHHLEAVVYGKLTIANHVTAKNGSDVTLTADTPRGVVDLLQINLPLVLHEEHMSIHYAYEQGAGAPLSDYTEAEKNTGWVCGNFHALLREHGAQSPRARVSRIKSHNLGGKKLDQRRIRAHKRSRHEAYQVVHAAVNKAAVVASGYLSVAFDLSKSWERGFDRRTGFWAKYVLAEALESVTAQRLDTHVLVHAAYRWQVSHRTGHLKGERHGDHFIYLVARCRTAT